MGYRSYSKGGIVFVAALLSLYSLKLYGQATEFADVVPIAADDRHRAMEAYQAANNAEIHALLAVLRTKPEEGSVELWDSRRGYAASMLANLHAEEAVEPLLEMIDADLIQPEGSTQLPKDRLLISCLAMIGKPASKAVLSHIAADKSSVRAKMYLRVLYLVEGADVGRFMLQNAVDKEKDPDRMARLTKAIELFANADKAVP